MAALGNVSVTSAAIIEGSLIIGLSDGSVINCGYVQGPQGLGEKLVDKESVI